MKMALGGVGAPQQLGQHCTLPVKRLADFAQGLAGDYALDQRPLPIVPPLRVELP